MRGRGRGRESGVRTRVSDHQVETCIDGRMKLHYRTFGVDGKKSQMFACMSIHVINRPVIRTLIRGLIAGPLFYHLSRSLLSDVMKLVLLFFLLDDRRLHSSSCR